MDREQFYYEIKWSILQVIILGVAYTLTSLVFLKDWDRSDGYYSSHEFGFLNVNTYVTIIGGISMMWSFYALTLFYWVLKDELTYPINWHPISKIACFKAI